MDDGCVCAPETKEETKEETTEQRFIRENKIVSDKMIKNGILASGINKKIKSEITECDCIHIKKEIKSEHLHIDKRVKLESKESTHLTPHEHTRGLDTKFKCPDCNFSTTSSRKFDNHVRYHIPLKCPGYDCDYCDSSFTDQNILQSHLDEYHPVLECPNINNNYCRFVSRKTESLELHATLHKSKPPYVCPVCGKQIVTGSGFNLHILIHTNDKPHICHKCPKSFYETFFLRKHIREKHANSIIKCEMCEFTSFFPNLMEIHKNQCDGFKERHKPLIKCQECNFFARKQVTMDIHRTVHIGRPPYICPQCGLERPEADKFNKHILQHTNDKWVNCPYCTQSFTSKIRFREHVARRHSTKILKCSNCNFLSFAEKDMTDHKEYFCEFLACQSPAVIYNCDKCSFIASKTRSIRLHNVIHDTKCANNDIRQYNCPECTYHTKDIDKFNRHVRNHSNDKPFVCTDCKACFSIKASLNAHVASKHKP